MKRYNILNNSLGWLVAIIASVVYISTAEPTASLWDCGEYIATAYKLQVGHPPGAPTFQLLGRFFSLFAGNDVTKVAYCINVMSALCSGLTILFLFWSITMLVKKLALRNNSEMTTSKMIAIFGSGLVGALAYTFTDTFWFSAVEGEVYAMSSFCTAIVFWAMLKWEQQADDPHAIRWLVFIAYVIGLSIGVHLLNLLTVPACVFIYYFKRYQQTTTKGVLVASVLSLVILAGILYGIIPWIVSISGYFDRVFVNAFGFGFNVGTVFYFTILIAAIVWGLWYTHKKNKVVWNTIILSLAFILIGYSTFLTLVIRSNADTPIDENNPETAVGLLSYLNREQYGSTPLFKGPFYNAPIREFKDGDPTYVGFYVVKNGNLEVARFTEKELADKFVQEHGGDLKIDCSYEISNDNKGRDPVYDPKYTTIFPRMWNAEHADTYKSWGGIKNDPNNSRIPTMGNNLRFMFGYQIYYMYLRYFMWNFVGRQNDQQGFGGKSDGEWLSGIKFIDEARLGTQNLPDTMNHNKGRNAYYFLPLILGLIGLFYHFSKNAKDGVVILLLFFMTGLAIAIYLNMYAYQPRERDYAFAASFYAFAIWIGIGVYALYDKLHEKLAGKLSPAIGAVAITIVCLFAVPVLMASENWDDHDRSNRYTTIELAKSYLEACAPNAILFTNGDNDTFPLWYAQEVEGVRTDVRVCNLSLLNTDWYIDQMKRKAYDSDPLPISMTQDQYRDGTRDYLIVREDTREYLDLKDMFDFMMKEDARAKLQLSSGKMINYLPTRNLIIRVNKENFLKNSTLTKADEANMVDTIKWTLPNQYVHKSTLAVLDMLAHNDWKRPIYFAITAGDDALFGLKNYLQSEGMVYRLVPVRTEADRSRSTFYGTANTDLLYKHLMEDYKWESLSDPRIYVNEDLRRMTNNIRSLYVHLAEKLVDERKFDKAEEVLDRCLEVIPNETVPYNYVSMYCGRIYLSMDTPTAKAKGEQVMAQLIKNCEDELAYIQRLPVSIQRDFERTAQIDATILQQAKMIVEFYKSNSALAMQEGGEVVAEE